LFNVLRTHCYCEDWFLHTRLLPILWY
jgi:hypothetical protein